MLNAGVGHTKGAEDPWAPVMDQVNEAARRALERKADDVQILDVRSLSSATDFFVIATGRSDVQVRAIAEHVIASAKGRGVRPEHVEGLDQGRWVLIDYIDHVVHVFHPQVRDFYQLETLWGDAISLAVPEP
ncbi:MAG: ribosome silencing factor [Longimicrobiales bacterium]